MFTPVIKYPTFQSSAARRTVHQYGPGCVSDLCFLEEWAAGRVESSAASILRASQIRRTNPALVKEIDRTLPPSTPNALSQNEHLKAVFNAPNCTLLKQYWD